jgi:hypothetical protein
MAVPGGTGHNKGREGGQMASQDVAAAVQGLDESLQALPATMISALNGWRLINPEHDPSDPTSQETYSFPEWLVRSSVRAGRAEAMATAALEAVKALAAVRPGLDPEQVLELIERRVDAAIS